MKTDLKNSPFLRFISTLLVASFLVEQLAWAAPEAAKISLGAPSKAHFKLPVGPSVARLEDVYRAAASEHTIYLIQDAHTNSSAQLNLAKTLDALIQADPGLRTVFVEAGFGNDTLWPVRQYASDKERARLAKIELKKGLLHGEEYLNLTGNVPFAIWGVEDKVLYEKAVSAYRATRKNRPRLQQILDRIQNTQDYLQSRVLNPLLLAFDRERIAYEKGDVSLTDYLQTLKHNKNSLALKLSSPELEKLWKLRALEQTIDFRAAQEEQVRATASLSAADRGELERAAHRPGKLKADDARDGEEAYWALLEEKIGAENGFAALSKYLEYRRRTRDLKLPEILAEIQALEGAVLGKLALHEDETVFLAAEKQLALQRKLFAFTLTNEEFDAYKDLSKDLPPKRLLGFLNQRLMEQGNAPEKALFLEEIYEKLIAEAEAFYRITLDRDGAFLKNLFPRLAESGQTKAVLITGGYHTKNLKELLKARGVSYISITPQVLEETNLKRYEEILLGGSAASAGAPALKIAAPGRMARTLGRTDVAGGWVPFMPGKDFAGAEGARLAAKKVLITTITKSLAGFRPVRATPKKLTPQKLNPPRAGARLAQKPAPKTITGLLGLLEEIARIDAEYDPAVMQDVRRAAQAVARGASEFWNSVTSRSSLFSFGIFGFLLGGVTAFVEGAIHPGAGVATGVIYSLGGSFGNWLAGRVARSLDTKSDRMDAVGYVRHALLSAFEGGLLAHYAAPGHPLAVVLGAFGGFAAFSGIAYLHTKSESGARLSRGWIRQAPGAQYFFVNPDRLDALGRLQGRERRNRKGPAETALNAAVQAGRNARAARARPVLDGADRLIAEIIEKLHLSGDLTLDPAIAELDKAVGSIRRQNFKGALSHIRTAAAYLTDEYSAEQAGLGRVQSILHSLDRGVPIEATAKAGARLSEESLTVKLAQLQAAIQEFRASAPHSYPNLDELADLAERWLNKARNNPSPEEIVHLHWAVVYFAHHITNMYNMWYDQWAQEQRAKNLPVMDQMSWLGFEPESEGGLISSIFSRLVQADNIFGGKSWSGMGAQAALELRDLSELQMYLIRQRGYDFGGISKYMRAQLDGILDRVFPSYRRPWVEIRFGDGKILNNAWSNDFMNRHPYPEQVPFKSISWKGKTLIVEIADSYEAAKNAGRSAAGARLASLRPGLVGTSILSALTVFLSGWSALQIYDWTRGISSGWSLTGLGVLLSVETVFVAVMLIVPSIGNLFAKLYWSVKYFSEADLLEQKLFLLGFPDTDIEWARLNKKIFSEIRRNVERNGDFGVNLRMVADKGQVVQDVTGSHEEQIGYDFHLVSDSYTYRSDIEILPVPARPAAAPLAFASLSAGRSRRSFLGLALSYTGAAALPFGATAVMHRKFIRRIDETKRSRQKQLEEDRRRAFDDALRRKLENLQAEARLKRREFRIFLRQNGQIAKVEVPESFREKEIYDALVLVFGGYRAGTIPEMVGTNASNLPIVFFLGFKRYNYEAEKKLRDAGRFDAEPFIGGELLQIKAPLSSVLEKNGVNTFSSGQIIRGLTHPVVISGDGEIAPWAGARLARGEPKESVRWMDRTTGKILQPEELFRKLRELARQNVSREVPEGIIVRAGAERPTRVLYVLAALPVTADDRRLAAVMEAVVPGRLVGQFDPDASGVWLRVYDLEEPRPYGPGYPHLLGSLRLDDRIDTARIMLSQETRSALVHLAKFLQRGTDPERSLAAVGEWLNHPEAAPWSRDKRHHTPAHVLIPAFGFKPLSASAQAFILWGSAAFAAIPHAFGAVGTFLLVATGAGVGWFAWEALRVQWAFDSWIRGDADERASALKVLMRLARPSDVLGLSEADRDRVFGRPGWGSQALVDQWRRSRPEELKEVLQLTGARLANWSVLKKMLGGFREERPPAAVSIPFASRTLSGVFETGLRADGIKLDTEAGVLPLESGLSAEKLYQRLKDVDWIVQQTGSVVLRGRHQPSSWIGAIALAPETYDVDGGNLNPDLAWFGWNPKVTYQEAVGLFLNQVNLAEGLYDLRVVKAAVGPSGEVLLISRHDSGARLSPKKRHRRAAPAKKVHNPPAAHPKGWKPTSFSMAWKYYVWPFLLLSMAAAFTVHRLESSGLWRPFDRQTPIEFSDGRTQGPDSRGGYRVFLEFPNRSSEKFAESSLSKEGRDLVFRLKGAASGAIVWGRVTFYDSKGLPSGSSSDLLTTPNGDIIVPLHDPQEVGRLLFEFRRPGGGNIVDPKIVERRSLRGLIGDFFGGARLAGGKTAVWAAAAFLAAGAGGWVLWSPKTIERSVVPSAFSAQKASATPTGHRVLPNGRIEILYQIPGSLKNLTGLRLRFPGQGAGVSFRLGFEQRDSKRPLVLPFLGSYDTDPGGGFFLSPSPVGAILPVTTEEKIKMTGKFSIQVNASTSSVDLSEPENYPVVEVETGGRLSAAPALQNPFATAEEMETVALDFREGIEAIRKHVTGRLPSGEGLVTAVYQDSTEKVLLVQSKFKARADKNRGREEPVPAEASRVISIDDLEAEFAKKIRDHQKKPRERYEVFVLVSEDSVSIVENPASVVLERAARMTLAEFLNAASAAAKFPAAPEFDESDGATAAGARLSAVRSIDQERIHDLLRLVVKLSAENPRWKNNPFRAKELAPHAAAASLPSFEKIGTGEAFEQKIAGLLTVAAGQGYFTLAGRKGPEKRYQTTKKVLEKVRMDDLFDFLGKLAAQDERWRGEFTAKELAPLVRQADLPLLRGMGEEARFDKIRGLLLLAETHGFITARGEGSRHEKIYRLAPEFLADFLPSPPAPPQRRPKPAYGFARWTSSELWAPHKAFARTPVIVIVEDHPGQAAEYRRISKALYDSGDGLAAQWMVVEDYASFVKLSEALALLETPPALVITRDEVNRNSSNTSGNFDFENVNLFSMVQNHGQRTALEIAYQARQKGVPVLIVSPESSILSQNTYHWAGPGERPVFPTVRPDSAEIASRITALLGEQKTVAAGARLTAIGGSPEKSGMFAVTSEWRLGARKLPRRVYSLAWNGKIVADMKDLTPDFLQKWLLENLPGYRNLGMDVGQKLAFAEEPESLVRGYGPLGVINRGEKSGRRELAGLLNRVRAESAWLMDAESKVKAGDVSPIKLLKIKLDAYESTAKGWDAYDWSTMNVGYPTIAPPSQERPTRLDDEFQKIRIRALRRFQNIANSPWSLSREALLQRIQNGLNAVSEKSSWRDLYSRAAVVVDSYDGGSSITPERLRHDLTARGMSISDAASAVSVLFVGAGARLASTAASNPRGETARKNKDLLQREAGGLVSDHELRRVRAQVSVEPAAAALYQAGILQMLDRRTSMTALLDYARTTQGGANDGYLHGALAVMESEGYLTRFIPKPDPKRKSAYLDEMEFELTDRGRQMLQLAPEYLRASEFIPVLKRMTEYLFASKATGPPFTDADDEEFKELLNHVQSLKASKSQSEVYDQVISHVEGMIIAPISVAIRRRLAETGEIDLREEFSLAAIQGDYSRETALRLDGAFRFLAERGFVTINGDLVRFTTPGILALSRAGSYGTPASYNQSYESTPHPELGFAVLPAFLFGSQDSLRKIRAWNDAVKGLERLVDRDMNIWGSEMAHDTYKPMLREALLALFNLPLELQSPVFPGMGVGTGWFEAFAYRTMLEGRNGEGTVRSRSLDTHPLIIIGADLSPVSLEAAEKTYRDAGIPYFATVQANVNDFDAFRSEINRVLRGLQDRHPGLYPGRTLTSRDASYETTMLIHNRPFINPREMKGPDLTDEEIMELIGDEEVTEVFVGPDGKSITIFDFVQNLYKHLLAWREDNPYGLMMLELFGVDSKLAAEHLRRSLHSSYLWTHILSNQMLVRWKLWLRVAEKADLVSLPQAQSVKPDTPVDDLGATGVFYLMPAERRAQVQAALAAGLSVDAGVVRQLATDRWLPMARAVIEEADKRQERLVERMPELAGFILETADDKLGERTIGPGLAVTPEEFEALAQKHGRENIESEEGVVELVIPVSMKNGKTRYLKILKDAENSATTLMARHITNADNPAKPVDRLQQREYWTQDIEAIAALPVQAGGRPFQIAARADGKVIRPGTHGVRTIFLLADADPQTGRRDLIELVEPPSTGARLASTYQIAATGSQPVFAVSGKAQWGLIALDQGAPAMKRLLEATEADVERGLQGAKALVLRESPDSMPAAGILLEYSGGTRFLSIDRNLASGETVKGALSALGKQNVIWQPAAFQGTASLTGKPNAYKLNVRPAAAVESQEADLADVPAAWRPLAERPHQYTKPREGHPKGYAPIRFVQTGSGIRLEANPFDEDGAIDTKEIKKYDPASLKSLVEQGLLEPVIKKKSATGARLAVSDEAWGKVRDEIIPAVEKLSEYLLNPEKGTAARNLSEAKLALEDGMRLGWAASKLGAAKGYLALAMRGKGNLDGPYENDLGLKPGTAGDFVKAVREVMDQIDQITGARLAYVDYARVEKAVVGYYERMGQKIETITVRLKGGREGSVVEALKAHSSDWVAQSQTSGLIAVFLGDHSIRSPGEEAGTRRTQSPQLFLMDSKSYELRSVLPASSFPQSDLTYRISFADKGRALVLAPSRGTEMRWEIAALSMAAFDAEEDASSVWPIRTEKRDGVRRKGEEHYITKDLRAIWIYPTGKFDPATALGLEFGEPLNDGYLVPITIMREGKSKPGQLSLDTQLRTSRDIVVKYFYGSKGDKLVSLFISRPDGIQVRRVKDLTENPQSRGGARLNQLQVAGQTKLVQLPGSVTLSLGATYPDVPIQAFRQYMARIPLAGREEMNRRAEEPDPFVAIQVTRERFMILNRARVEEFQAATPVVLEIAGWKYKVSSGKVIVSRNGKTFESTDSDLYEFILHRSFVPLAVIMYARNLSDDQLGSIFRTVTDTYEFTPALTRVVLDGGTDIRLRGGAVLDEESVDAQDRKHVFTYARVGLAVARQMLQNSQEPILMLPAKEMPSGDNLNAYLNGARLAVEPQNGVEGQGEFRYMSTRANFEQLGKYLNGSEVTGAVQKTQFALFGTRAPVFNGIFFAVGKDFRDADRERLQGYRFGRDEFKQAVPRILQDLTEQKLDAQQYDLSLASYEAGGAAGTMLVIGVHGRSISGGSGHGQGYGRAILPVRRSERHGPGGEGTRTGARLAGQANEFTFKPSQGIRENLTGFWLHNILASLFYGDSETLPKNADFMELVVVDRDGIGHSWKMDLGTLREALGPQGFLKQSARLDRLMQNHVEHYLGWNWRALRLRQETVSEDTKQGYRITIRFTNRPMAERTEVEPQTDILDQLVQLELEEIEQTLQPGELQKLNSGFITMDDTGNPVYLRWLELTERRLRRGGARLAESVIASPRQSSGVNSAEQSLSPGIASSLAAKERGGSLLAMTQNTGVRLSTSAVRNFILSVAFSVGSLFLSEARALPIGEEVYSLKQNANILYVIQENGAVQQIDLRADTIRKVRVPKASDLKHEESLEADLDRLRAANALRAETALVDTPHWVVVHLAGFYQNKGQLSGLILQLGSRLSQSAQVALVGTPEETRQAMELVQTLSPKNRKNFVPGFSGDTTLSQVHIAHKNVVAQVLQNPLSRNARIVTLESQMNGEGKIGAFAFGPVVELAELLVANKMTDARAFFIRMTGYNLTQEEFDQLTLGDLERIAKFAIQPVLWALAQEAQKLQVLLRSFESAA